MVDFRGLPRPRPLPRFRLLADPFGLGKSISSSVREKKGSPSFGVMLSISFIKIIILSHIINLHLLSRSYSMPPSLSKCTNKLKTL